MKPARRLYSETIGVTLGGGHRLKVSLAYEVPRRRDGTPPQRLREVVFVGRGKIGHGLDSMLHELGIKLSRILQFRDPETGEEAV